MASEMGVLKIPEEHIITKWRLQPGKMLLVDLEQGRLIPDDEIKAGLANSHPYQEWLDRTQIVVEELPDVPSNAQISNLALLDRQQVFGNTNDEVYAKQAITNCRSDLARRRRGSGMDSSAARRGKHRLTSALASRTAGLRQLYVERASAGDQVSATVVGQVDSLVANVTELFRRLRLKAERRSEVSPRLSTKTSSTSWPQPWTATTCWTLLANPRLWDNPQQRIREVQAAIEAVDAQLLDNIKQVNARRGLVFRVPLDGLIGPRKALDDWQRDFDSASGPE